MKGIRRRLTMLLLTAIAIVGFTAGCGDKSYKPAAIKEGVDKCEFCGMLIKDNAYASEIILKNEKALKFDDIGDLLQWLKKNGDSEVGASYVRDFGSKKWIELRLSTFVMDKSIHSPMSYGIIAFEKEADADAYLKDKAPEGKKLNADALRAMELEEPHSMKMDMKDMKDMKDKDMKDMNK